jgi:hypothetical protein
MEMYVNDEKRILQVQYEFNTLFPYLRIEFYAKAPKEEELFSLPISDLSRIGECRTKHDQDFVSIYATKRLMDLETEFREHLGIHVRLFCWENNDWESIPAYDTTAIGFFNTYSANKSKLKQG